MNLLVCVKQVPDTATRIKIQEGSNVIDNDGVQFVLNPYDEYAVEEAIKKRDSYGGSVTVLSLGPQKAKEVLRTCLAMGADKAKHIVTEYNNRLDGYLTALIISRVIEEKYNIIFCGKQAVDGDHAQVGIMLAEILEIPHLSIVTKLEIDKENNKVLAHREVEAGEEVIETSMPCLITCQKGLNEPRLPSLKGIMSAKKKEIKEIGLDSIGFTDDTIDSQRMIDYVALNLPPDRKGGTIIKEGNAKGQVENLMKFLKEEAKII